MTLDTFIANGFTVEIVQDQDTQSPRDDMTHGCELVYGHRQYDFPNDAGLALEDFDGWTEVASHLRNEGALLVLPVAMIDHSGLAFRVGTSFAEDPGGWDSGQIGVAYVTPQNWADTQGTKWTGSDEQIAQATRLITSDVEVYGQYVNGETYGYRITDEYGELIDDCWGFIGYDTVTGEAKEAAGHEEHEIKCNGRLDRAAGEIVHDGPCPLHAPPTVAEQIQDQFTAEANAGRKE